MLTVWILFSYYSLLMQDPEGLSSLQLPHFRDKISEVGGPHSIVEI